jgi:hypothetical protein
MRFRELARRLPSAPDTGRVDPVRARLDPRALAASAAPAPPLWAVRRDWPTGEHEFVTPRPTTGAVARALAADRAFWRRGPMRPALSVVRISRHDFDLHATARHGCRAPDCPLP